MPDQTDHSTYETLRVRIADHVAVATIDAPPVNVMTLTMLRDLLAFGHAVAADDEVRVVVLRSAHPDFFIAHFDVEVLVGMPTDTSPTEAPPTNRSARPNRFRELCDLFASMPKPTIAEIAGRVGGGGFELSSACDMRFGALDRTVINQMEVPLGILPGGGGTQRLPRMAGTGRAMEIVLGGVDVDAATAEAWGLLNRALPPAELTAHVDALAHRIAGFPPGAVRLAKASVRNAEHLPLAEGLDVESDLFADTLRLPGTNARMRRYLERGGQTRDVELAVAEAVTDLD